MLKSRVFRLRSSPTAPACSTTKRPMLKSRPRSTWRNGLTAEEHHLSSGPLSALPLNALSGVRLGSHDALPAARACRAKFCDCGARSFRPYTETKFEMEATYTLPLATMGGLPLAKFSGSSPGPLLDHSSDRFSALNA